MVTSASEDWAPVRQLSAVLGLNLDGESGPVEEAKVERKSSKGESPHEPEQRPANEPNHWVEMKPKLPGNADHKADPQPRARQQNSSDHWTT